MGRGQRRKKTKRLEAHQQEGQNYGQVQQRLPQMRQAAQKQERPSKQQLDRHQRKHKGPSSTQYTRPLYNPKNRPEWFFRHMEWLSWSSTDHNRRAFEEDLSDIENSKRECTYEEDGSGCECEMPVWREYAGDDEEERLFREAKYKRAIYKRERLPETSKHYKIKEKMRSERMDRQKNDEVKKVKSAIDTLLRNGAREEGKPLYYMSRNILSKFDLVSEDYTVPLDPDGIRVSRTISFYDMKSFRAMKHPSLRGTTELKVDRVLSGGLAIDCAKNPDNDIRLEFESFKCPQTTGTYRITTDRKDGARELKIEILSDDYIVLDVHSDAVFRDEVGKKLPNWPKRPLPQYRFYGINKALGGETLYQR
ncbi:hypothetical protein JMJ77_0013945 [Colletotrichum scovillei]|uniref:Uncharacterized protein n=1 Tax=Colletotrichum scovillei TaxID=1209932 RepID=A0A9P7R5Q2_9PEZI|nr:hypothetical protein JMJ77_0013945 [Colletotrichum scovillei]KAG7065467.1 hypothetical protein JMJ78_0012221 [Colletotrichum scovillei]KAG7068071.1 hypothetical protein JMJ76_0007768 [Colletotrichum scovillei]